MRASRSDGTGVITSFSLGAFPLNVTHSGRFRRMSEALSASDY